MLPRQAPCAQNELSPAALPALPTAACCRFAKTEGITVVTTRWVDASLEAGWCQDEAPFFLVADGGAPREGAGDSAAAALLPLAAGVEPAAARRAPPTAALLDEATTLSELAPGGSGGVLAAAVEPTAAAPAARGPSRLQRGASAADVAAMRGAADAAAADEEQEGGAAAQAAAALQGGAALQAAAAAAAAGMPTQEELDEQLEWDDDTPTFLDAVRLKLLGCSQAELREALGLVRAAERGCTASCWGQVCIPRRAVLSVWDAALCCLHASQHSLGS